MSKFSKSYGSQAKVGSSPIKSVGTKTAVNHSGASAYARDAKSDLFLLGVTNLVSEDTYYEKGADRDKRFAQLVHTVTSQDPDWVERFIPWLRNTANMRSASIAAAVEYAVAGGPRPAAVIDSACSRADEPAEVLSYWIGVHGGGSKKGMPSNVKRGAAAAAKRLYNEYSVAKYDGVSNEMRVGDVVQIAHPKPADSKQKALFKYALDARFGGNLVLDELPMLTARKNIDRGTVTRDQLLSDPELMKNAGMTWESLSGLGPMDGKAWEAVIPQMGYMALLRNLRNFEQQGVSKSVLKDVYARISDPAQVAKSRQLPFRFWSAYKNTNSLQAQAAIETALDLSLQNIPEFGGRTLVLVDTSGSMQSAYTDKGSISPVEIAALFGTALALKGENVTMLGFGDGVFEHRVKRGSSILPEVWRFANRIGEAGHGTNIAGAVAQWDGHDRIVLLTDMQTNGRYDRGTLRASNSSYDYGYGVRAAAPAPKHKSIPTNVPIYGFNLAGYATTQLGDKNEYELGGLTDATFKLIPLLEARQAGTWPF